MESVLKIDTRECSTVNNTTALGQAEPDLRFGNSHAVSTSEKRRETTSGYDADD